MCGRLTREQGADMEFSERHRLSGADLDLLNLGLTWNAAPGQPLPVIVEDAQGRPHVRHMQWGLRARHGDGPKPINARAETLLQRAMFRNLVPSRRCLVPATGWYEWRPEGGKRQPYYLSVTDHPLFTFAGLYDAWIDNDGAVVGSYCIITTTPAPSIAHVHDRMPVVLAPDDEARWLDRGLRDPRAVLPLLRAYPDDRLTSHRVGAGVNRTGNDGPDLIRFAGGRLAIEPAVTQVAMALGAA